MSKVLLVTGATGKQGGAVIDNLIKSKQSQDFEILAVTRDPSSGSAQRLANKSPLIKIVKGDFTDVPALFQTASRAVHGRPIWGVYSVQALGKEEVEERHGKAVVDASVAAGVKHFVYSSVDRAGNEKSWANPTDVPHFRSKHNIELHLREKAGSSMGWTILRPVAFMDNWEPGFGVRAFFTVLSNNLKDRPLQLIACNDIGYAAAQAFLNPAKYNQKAVGLAGDELTVEQMQRDMAEVLGKRPGLLFSFLGSAIQPALGYDMNQMIKWFAKEGYGVNIPQLKQDMPLTTWKEWLKTSKFVEKS